ncbi:transposase [Hymenobacter actinosclerus]|uniref:transposase n=1 Tax=Hymenobacter actinosclerus TaxID=82805 RepID=UPI0011603D1A|nr:transposase [Hymenobacter actinosclerus]
MTEKLNSGGLPATRKKYTPAFKAECVRQVAAGARQSDVARAQGICRPCWGAGNARPWKPPCPAAPSAKKSGSYVPRSNAWKWRAIC